MKLDFCGKVVLITGGTSGIGLSAARLFLNAGAAVAICGRSTERGEKALRDLAAGENLAFFPADVSVVRECNDLVDRVGAKFGRLDVLVNSAGEYLEKSVGEMTEADFDSIMGVNVKGTYFMTRAALPYLAATGGSVVNVSSDAGINGNLLCSAYCASKGAVVLLTKSLALEAAPSGVRVNCVCPGDVETPMLERQVSGHPCPESYRNDMKSIYPLGRIGSADEISGVIVFLASTAASFVTGAAWAVDGGLTSA